MEKIVLIISIVILICALGTSKHVPEKTKGIVGLIVWIIGLIAMVGVLKLMCFFSLFMYTDFILPAHKHYPLGSPSFWFTLFLIIGYFLAYKIIVWGQKTAIEIATLRVFKSFKFGFIHLFIAMMLISLVPCVVTISQTVRLWDIKADNVAAVEESMRHGVDPNRPIFEGLTPLVFAAQANAKNTAKVLIKNGANINSGQDGRTPLMVAVAYNSLDTAKVLLESGADIYAKDRWNQNALDLVKARQAALGAEGIEDWNGRATDSKRMLQLLSTHVKQ